ncbi:MAG: hypothetical protein QOD99_1247, partial [Chthoniobacter sp.]|nr:hypothetical protein [Chthoniobacter sp.]
ATNAVLTVPIPPHTTFLNATNSIAPFKTIADKHGRITAMKWNFASIPKGADKAVDLLVTVDNAAAFSSKDPNAGFGQVISLKGAALDPKNGYNLSALEQGIESSAILRDEIKTRILGSLKLSVHQDVNSVGPGGLISYRLDCENDGGQPLSGAIVTDEIPITTALGIDGLPVRTQLVALYEFNVNGDALNTQLPNPGAFTNPAIIYARTSFIPKIDADNLPIPASALPLVVPIVGAKTGAEVELKDLDQDTVNVLVNDGIIAPAKIKWTMGTIPAAHVAGQSNVRSVAFTVRVPYDIPTVDSNGQPTMVVNGHYSKEKKPTTYLNDHSSYDFFVPGSNLSALYGNPPAALKITIDDSIPSAKPQLGLGKFALGSQTLNNPNFHGNGFATIAGVGDVTTAVEHHGVDFALFYFNSDDAQAPGADAHGVVIHDVIPEGMQLRGFFKQHVGPSLTSGALEVGKTYAIAQFAEGDDFTNVGAASNEPGTAFTATGTTPADWSHGSALNLEGPMFASQFTFYDKNGNIVAGVDPNSNQNNMALVTSMDIRLGSVQNVTLIPKGTGGYVQYTCEATISPTTVIKYPGHEVQGTPGLIHSFGGFEPGQGLSEKLQGFYLTTSDLLAPIQGGPDDVLVRVLADVSWDFPAPERKTSKAKPTDIVAFDFNFTQNGDVTAEGGHVDFVVPQGTTFLNGTVTPPAGAAVSTGTNLVVANGSTQYDCRPTFTDDSSVVTATQTGANVQLALNDVPGHTSRAVRVFLKINSPLDPALAQSHAFVFDNQTTIIAGGSPSSSARISRSVSSSSDEGTAHASGLDPMAVSNTNAPHLSLGRSAPYSVQKGGKFTYTISFANTGGAAATNVNVGMQVPFGTTFVSADNGILRDNILGKPMSNPHPFTATERSKDQVKQTGGGHNILTWHYDSVPAQAVGLIKVTVQCFGSFADDCVRDHSLYINADNAASAVLSPNPIGTWVIGKPFDTSKWEVLQCFCQHLGIAINKQTAPALQAFVNTLTKNSKVQAFGGIDTLSLTNGVKVFQLGNNQVLCISNDGNSLISNDGGTLISNDGGTLVATGAGNAISISNIPSLGTKTAEYLLDHVADVIAAGAGNVVAAGAGNLISNDGGTLLSNHPGGTDASIVSHDGGTVVAAGAGNVIAAGAGNILGVGQAGVVSHDGGTIVSHDGGTLLTSDGSGLTAVGAGQIISNDGNSVISNDGNSLVHAAGGE